MDIARFIPIIKQASAADLERDCTLGGRLSLEEAGPLSVSYAPFDHVNKTALIVLVGITPGRRQAVDALLALRAALLAGCTVDGALATAKATASFAGAMRSNLVRLFDHVGLHDYLAITSCIGLFGRDSHLVHYTSALRYPVFNNGGNYSGNPRLERTPLLARMVRTYLFEEIGQLPEAVWIPLGGAAESSLSLAVSEGVLSAEKVLSGFPHASGANAERIAYFVGAKPRNMLSSKTNPDVIDARKASLLDTIARLGRTRGVE